MDLNTINVEITEPQPKKYHGGFKSAQRSSNFIDVGDQYVRANGASRNAPNSQEANQNMLKMPRFSVQQPESRGSYIDSLSGANNNIANLPTHYSSSRFANGRGGAKFGGDESHYKIKNNKLMGPPSSGYIGQGLNGINVGRLEPTESDANTTSFYSNNTSNLNNSRYLLNRRDTRIENMMHVGKVIPNNMMKSIDNQSNNPQYGQIAQAGYGSHTSNFANQPPQYSF